MKATPVLLRRRRRRRQPDGALLVACLVSLLGGSLGQTGRTSTSNRALVDGCQWRLAASNDWACSRTTYPCCPRPAPDFHPAFNSQIVTSSVDVVTARRALIWMVPGRISLTLDTALRTALHPVLPAPDAPASSIMLEGTRTTSAAPTLGPTRTYRRVPIQALGRVACN